MQCSDWLTSHYVAFYNKQSADTDHDYNNSFLSFSQQTLVSVDSVNFHANYPLTNLKGIAHAKLKFPPVATHHYADGGSGDIL